MHRGAVWLCLLMQVVLGVPAALGLSLCLDADGCIAIEIEHADIPCLGEREHGIAAVGAGAEAYPCRDVPVLESHAYEARLANSLSGPPALAFNVSAALPAPPPTGVRTVTAPSFTALAPRLRRSIVLIV